MLRHYILYLLLVLAGPLRAEDNALAQFLHLSGTDALLKAQTEGSPAGFAGKMEDQLAGIPGAAAIRQQMATLDKKQQGKALPQCLVGARNLISRRMGAEDIAALNGFAASAAGQIFFAAPERANLYTHHYAPAAAQPTKEQYESINRFLVSETGLKWPGLDQDIAAHCRSLLQNDRSTGSAFGMPVTE